MIKAGICPYPLPPPHPHERPSGGGRTKNDRHDDQHRTGYLNRRCTEAGSEEFDVDGHEAQIQRRPDGEKEERIRREFDDQPREPEAEGSNADMPGCACQNHETEDESRGNPEVLRVPANNSAKDADRCQLLRPQSAAVQQDKISQSHRDDDKSREEPYW